MIQLGSWNRMQHESFLRCSEALTVCIGAGRIALFLGNGSTRSAVSFSRQWQTMTSISTYCMNNLCAGVGTASPNEGCSVGAPTRLCRLPCRRLFGGQWWRCSKGMMEQKVKGGDGPFRWKKPCSDVEPNIKLQHKVCKFIGALFKWWCTQCC
jgi:hypothetical protein